MSDYINDEDLFPSATRNSDRVSPGSEVPATNDPMPYEHPNGAQAMHPFPGFKPAEVPADEGKLRHRVRNAISANTGVSLKLVDQAAENVMEILATELQKARAEAREEAWDAGYDWKVVVRIDQRDNPGWRMPRDLVLAVDTRPDGNVFVGSLDFRLTPPTAGSTP